MRRTLGILAMGAVLVAATPTTFGSWAVVTMQEWPEYLEVGKPSTLAFKIRSHGKWLLDDRSPTVRLANTNPGFLARLFRRDRVAAVNGSEVGLYEVTITPEDTGEVSLVIDTDVARWKVQLLPLRVVAAGHTPSPLAAHERGRQLFVAKGCATCHAKQDDPALADWQLMSVGPPLTGRTFPADWLAQKLADPAQYRDAATNDFVMPDLALDEREIAALVSFLNQRTVTAEASDGR